MLTEQEELLLLEADIPEPMPAPEAAAAPPVLEPAPETVEPVPESTELNDLLPKIMELWSDQVKREEEEEAKQMKNPEEIMDFVLEKIKELEWNVRKLNDLLDQFEIIFNNRLEQLEKPRMPFTNSRGGGGGGRGGGGQRGGYWKKG